MVATPQFEVATLKRSPPPSGDSYQINLGTVSNGRTVLTNVNLSDCIKFAYGLSSDDQLQGPDWVKSKAILFDIVATSAPETPHDQAELMMRSLLAERLQLAIHHEQRELRYLALTPGKGGSKMRKALSDSPQFRDNSGGNGRVYGNQMPMTLLARLLSRFEHQIVVDATGLEGFWQVRLEWTPGTGRPDILTDDNAAGISLFTAVQEQLGLRLESRKGPLDVVVVDHAEKIPAEN